MIGVKRYYSSGADLWGQLPPPPLCSKYTTRCQGTCSLVILGTLDQGKCISRCYGILIIWPPLFQKSGSARVASLCTFIYSPIGRASHLCLLFFFSAWLCWGLVSFYQGQSTVPELYTTCISLRLVLTASMSFIETEVQHH